MKCLLSTADVEAVKTAGDLSVARQINKKKPSSPTGHTCDQAVNSNEERSGQWIRWLADSDPQHSPDSGMSTDVAYRGDWLADGREFTVCFTRVEEEVLTGDQEEGCLLYTSPSPRDRQKSRMPSSA